MSPVERSAGGGGGGFTNPMTTAGDIIIENAVPAPARLGIGSAGQVLTVSAGLPSWQPAAGGMTTLFDSTLGADTASIDTGAGGIAGGHIGLFVMIAGRTDDAAAAVNVNVNVNNDAGANYTAQTLLGNNASATAAWGGAALTAWTPGLHGSGGTASNAGFIELWIPNYTGTTFNKVARSSEMILDGTAANNFAIFRALSWANTSAITRLAVSGQGAAKLKTGTRMTIFGVG